MGPDIHKPNAIDCPVYRLLGREALSNFDIPWCLQKSCQPTRNFQKRIRCVDLRYHARKRRINRAFVAQLSYRTSE